MKKKVIMTIGEKIKFVFLFASCFGMCIVLSFWSLESKSGVSHALSVCAETVIPSVFPFMFLSSFMSESGIFDCKFKIGDKISNFLFRLPQCASAVFVMSCLGGFPIGGKMTKQLYERGAISQNQAERLLLFCVNPGPAFAVGILGETFFGNKNIGYIIYSSVLASNLFIGVLSRFLSDLGDGDTYEKATPDIPSAFFRAGSLSASSTVGVCTFVIIFACLESVLEAAISNETVVDVLSGILEVTTGCERLAKFSSVPLISGITAWGGLSVHCQIYDCIKKSGLDMKLFLTSRLLSAGISAIISDILLKLFPQEINVVSVSAGISSLVSESSFSVSIAMLLTSCVFLVSDYSFNSRRKY